MNYPPEPPDPNALTQPIPIVQPPPPPRPNVPPPSQTQYQAQSTGLIKPAYAHRFGSLPLYLCARLGALFIDLFGLAFVLTSFGFYAFDRGLQTFAGRDQAGFVTLGGGAFLVGLLLAYLTESLTGTTLGKMTFGLHTRRIDGGHAGGGRVLIRYLFIPIDLLLVGPILALVTKRHQRLGDLLAGTVVSGSRIGIFAPILGLLVLGGLAYAQFAYGGGVSSAIETAAETSNVVPGFVMKAASLVGLGSLKLPSIPIPSVPVPSATPVAQATPLVQSSPQPEASANPTVAPSVQETPLPAVSESPGAQPSAVENVNRPGYPTDPPAGTDTPGPSDTAASGVQ